MTELFQCAFSVIKLSKHIPKARFSLWKRTDMGRMHWGHGGQHVSMKEVHDPLKEAVVLLAWAGSPRYNSRSDLMSTSIILPNSIFK